MKIIKQKDKESVEKFLERLEEKAVNIYLFNFRVVTLRTWNKMKKDKSIYQYFRSNECDHECYCATYELAKIIRNPNVKILWISVTEPNGDKWGHAILRKGSWIYDSNERRTHKLNNYMKYWQAEVFKEFDISQYSQYDFMVENWDHFRTWCEKRGVMRSTEEN